LAQAAAACYTYSHPGEMARSPEGLSRHPGGPSRVSGAVAAEWNKTVILKGATPGRSPDGAGRLPLRQIRDGFPPGTGDGLAASSGRTGGAGRHSFELPMRRLHPRTAGESVRERLGDAGVIATISCLLPVAIKSVKSGDSDLEAYQCCWRSDIGNTNVTLGYSDGERLRATWRMATDINRMADEYAALLLNCWPRRA